MSLMQQITAIVSALTSVPAAVSAAKAALMDFASFLNATS